MMGTLLLLSYKEKIIGTKTNLLLRTMLKITFMTTVAVMWWMSVGVLMWKPLCFPLRKGFQKAAWIFCFLNKQKRFKTFLMIQFSSARKCQVPNLCTVLNLYQSEPNVLSFTFWPWVFLTMELLTVPSCCFSHFLASFFHILRSLTQMSYNNFTQGKISIFFKQASWCVKFSREYWAF